MTLWFSHVLNSEKILRLKISFRFLGIQTEHCIFMEFEGAFSVFSVYSVIYFSIIFFPFPFSNFSLVRSDESASRLGCL